MQVECTQRGTEAPGDDFCDLWNELAIATQLPDHELTLLSNMMFIPSFVRVVHVSLHHDTESQSPPSLANTATALQNPSSYTPVLFPVASTNPGSNIPVAFDSGDAILSSPDLRGTL